MRQTSLDPTVVSDFSDALGWSQLGAFYSKVPGTNRWVKRYLDRQYRDNHHQLTLQISEAFENGGFQYSCCVYAMKFGIASGFYNLPITEDIDTNRHLAEVCATLLHRDNFSSERNARMYQERYPDVRRLAAILKKTGFVPHLPATFPEQVPDLLARVLARKDL